MTAGKPRRAGASTGGRRAKTRARTKAKTRAGTKAKTKARAKATSTAKTIAKSKPRSARTLDRMAPKELATILRALLAKHPELRAEAEQIAVDMIASPSIEDVAEDVYYAVTDLGIDSLHGRTGKQPWGYVKPTEAAWELLEEAVGDFLADMKRRAELGLCEAAEAMCCGIVLGLHMADSEGHDGPLGWAEDFPAEEASHAVAELIRSCPPRGRMGTRKRLIAALGQLVPDWREMLTRAADSAMKRR